MDFLDRLTARSFGTPDAVQPRPVSRFEPRRGLHSRADEVREESTERTVAPPGRPAPERAHQHVRRESHTRAETPSQPDAAGSPTIERIVTREYRVEAAPRDDRSTPSPERPLFPTAPRDVAEAEPPAPQSADRGERPEILPARESNEADARHASAPVEARNDAAPPPVRITIRRGDDRARDEAARGHVEPKPMRERLQPAAPEPKISPLRDRRSAGDGRAAPDIHVTIGRIEVRAAAPAPAAPRQRGDTAPSLSLEEYLRKREGGTR